MCKIHIFRCYTPVMFVSSLYPVPRSLSSLGGRPMENIGQYKRWTQTSLMNDLIILYYSDLFSEHIEYVKHFLTGCN